jgi:hypothetical protein
VRRFGNTLALELDVAINEDDTERIRELCSLIAGEQDRHKLLKLIGELSLALHAKEERLRATHSTKLEIVRARNSINQ